MADLLVIRNELARLAQGVFSDIGVDQVQWDMDPSQMAPLPTSGVVGRFRFGLPRRVLVGFEGAPLVRQIGSFGIDFLFPSGTGPAEALDPCRAAAEEFRERSLVLGLRINGDARIARSTPRLSQGVGEETIRQDSRVSWSVDTEWEITNREPQHGDHQPRIPLASDQQAFLAVRQVWASRIEAAIAGESWPGLLTRWDDVPAVPVAPPLPWAGYWIGAIANADLETSGAVVSVIGRSLVQLHTSRTEGAARFLPRLDRILAEHNRATNSVAIGPVDIEAQFHTPAATIQTNLRIPFRYDRAR